jgi:hypothetical protein
MSMVGGEFSSAEVSVIEGVWRMGLSERRVIGFEEEVCVWCEDVCVCGEVGVRSLSA